MRAAERVAVLGHIEAQTGGRGGDGWVRPVGEGERYRFEAGKWAKASRERTEPADEKQAIAAGFAAGKVEIRTVPRRQAYVGGVPVGDPFE